MNLCLIPKNHNVAVSSPFCGSPHKKSPTIWALYWGPLFLETPMSDPYVPVEAIIKLQRPEPEELQVLDS